MPGLREGVAEDGSADDSGEGGDADDLVHKVVTPTNLVLTGKNFCRMVRIGESFR